MSGENALVTRVLAIRHGETEWNAQGRIQGQLDLPLSDVGRRQVQRLSHAVADEDIAAVYSSDLSRAYETAQAVARGAQPTQPTQLPITIDIGLRERAFGAFEGLTFDEIKQRWPDQAERWRKRDATFGPEGGETLNQFYARSVETVARLAALHPGQTIAVVSHGGVMDCLYRAATRLALDAPRSWTLGNASVNRLLYSPSGFALIGWNDDQHLADAALDEFADAGGASTSASAPTPDRTSEQVPTKARAA